MNDAVSDDAVAYVRRIRVLDGGLLSTVQDLGRFGFAASGVSASGPADWYSARAANRLVGNVDGAAVIETTLSGFSFLPADAIRIAVTGADAPLTIGGSIAHTWRAHDVNAGERVCVGSARRGLRSYIAFDGGVDVPSVMGSRSTDVGSGFGGKILASGDELALGADISSTDARPRLAYDDSARLDLAVPVVLRTLPGPQADRIGRDALDALCASRYVASTRSSRQALRLEGEPIALHSGADVISAGTVAGCVQITSEGLPIVLLAEHHTTGGYAGALYVVTADVPRAAQVRPGDAVAFRIVGVAEAAAALDAVEARLHASGPMPAEGEEDIGARLSRGFFEGA